MLVFNFYKWLSAFWEKERERGGGGEEGGGGGGEFFLFEAQGATVLTVKEFLHYIIKAELS